ncbi:MAG: hypothetical protein ACFFAN_11315 [Promethearchaeota archaeon]
MIFGCIFGSLVIYQSRKRNVKFLFYTGLLIIFTSLLYLGQFIDFLTILLTGNNLNPPHIYALLCYMWVAPAVIVGYYIGAELMIPERKKIIVIVYTILGIVFELFLWLDTDNSFIFNLPKTPGETIIDVNFNRTHPTFILIVIFLISTTIFLSFGFLYKAFKSSGIIRKKFFYLSLANIIFVLTGALDSLSSPGNMLFFVRIGMISSSWFWYFGLKEENGEIKKVPLKEKRQIEESKSSLIETLSLSKPMHISEEEVIFHREQIICLVCKGKVERHNYICPTCKAMYCQNCTQALIKLENACWGCNTPIDKTKPVNLSKKEKEVINIEKIEKKNK